jgi:hypothetical protein
MLVDPALDFVADCGAVASSVVAVASTDARGTIQEILIEA